MKNRIITLILAFALLAALLPQLTLPAKAADVISGKCGRNLTWTLNRETGVLTISGSGEMDDWNIEHDNPWGRYASVITSVQIEQGVTSIGEEAFESTNLTEIEIPNSVSSIKRCAFNLCNNLTSVTIPDSVTNIGQSAFSRCEALTGIVIPGSVSNIDQGAFGGCEKLESITISEGVKSIGSSAFSSCSSLMSVTIPDSVASIGDHAFYHCTGLTSVTLPENMTKIDDSLFNYCTALTSVAIPDGVTSIGVAAFRDCISLTEITIPDSVTNIGQSAFYGCSSLTRITILGDQCEIYDDSRVLGTPGKTTIIGNDDSTAQAYALEHGYLFISLSAPDENLIMGACGDNLTWSLDTFSGILTISGTGAMNDWNNYQLVPWARYRGDIKTVSIGQGATSIGAHAFSSCNNLMSIAIPDSVTSIGYAAFSDCISLMSVTVPDSVISIGENTFGNCAGLTSVTIPDSVTSIGNGVFSSCSGLRSVTIPDSVTSIGNYAFCECSGLTSVTIPDSVTSIGYYAFYKCSGLTSITLSNSVTSIGELAFSECSSLTSVAVPESVVNIGNSAFSSCAGLTSVTIPGSVTSIDYNAFAYCNNLESVTVLNDNCEIASLSSGGTLGNSVKTTIYGNADSAAMAYAQEYGYLFKTLPESGEDLIAGKCWENLTWKLYKDTGLLIISGSGEMDYFYDEDAFGMEYYTPWCDYCSEITSVQIDYGVTSIGFAAFYNFSNLTEIMISGDVISIGAWAFGNCENLTTVTIPDSVRSIGPGAFYRCSSLTSVTILSNQCEINDDSSALGTPGKTTIFGNDDSTAQAYAQKYGYLFKTLDALEDNIITDECGDNLTWSFNKKTGELTIIGSGEMANWLPYWNVPWYSFRRDIKSITLPDGLTSIGIAAFLECSGLTHIDLPDGLTTIGKAAFQGCSSLMDINLPNSVASIGKDVFYGCCSMTRVKLSDSVVRIETDVFYDCRSLTDVAIPDSVKTIEDGAFGSCTSLNSITIPESVMRIGDHAFGGCSSLKEITVLNPKCDIEPNDMNDPATCLGIPEITTVYGYYYSTAQTYAEQYGYVFVPLNAQDPDDDIDIFSGVYDDVLSWTLNLDTNLLTISCIKPMEEGDPSGIIPWEHFHSRITAVEIEDGVPLIGDSFFAYFENLTSVSIPDSVMSIGDYAFKNCSSLTEITIPACVTSIGAPVFSGCCSLTTINVEDGNPNYCGENGALFDVTKEHLYCVPSASGAYQIPEGVETIGDYAFFDNPDLTEIIIPDGVISINNYAFSRCSNLSSVTIPDTVYSLGECAFSFCSSLTEIMLPQYLDTIEREAFAYCPALTSITVLSPEYDMCWIDWTARTLGSPDTTTLYGHSDSMVAEYADHFGYKFIPFEGASTSYTVSYNANGGTGEPSAQEEMKGMDIYISSSTPTKSFTVTFDALGGSVIPAFKTVDCAFKNWNTASNGSGTAYNPGEEFTADEDVTLYAQWTNPTVGDLPTPAWETDDTEYIFKGWYTTEGDGGVRVTESYVVTGDMTVYARYENTPKSSLSGECGRNLKWNFDESSGKLTITGSGAMYNWGKDSNLPPWYPFAGRILSLSLPDELTSIGRYAFYGCSSLEEVRIIPNSTLNIEGLAFKSCGSLRSVIIGRHVKSIEGGVFENCTALEKVTILNPKCDIARNSTTLGDPELKKTVIYGVMSVFGDVKDSAVKEYAELYGYTFKELFIDVPPNAYYTDPILWAVEKEITNGTGEGKFSPEATCTRAQVVTFLWRANGRPDPVGTNTPFTDVKPGVYYDHAVLWAVEQGITKGVSATAFSPDAGCTRGQVVTFLWRANGQPEPEADNNPFTDVTSDAYYYKAVLWAVEKGVTNGTSADKFSPDATCTRGQIVTFLYRAMSGQG